ncbi:cell division protein FtsX [Helicobacter sp. 12S02634-8]|uniref:cell division protein FtsX n=1 Tax=Helicobacter sp. 12S02634-8 TaxID=1476199 RepID=UPI000BA5E342|nr:cell division protein FtsX [Helicobacter sp. 12S02634-8]PAF47482.1 cell division protein FtsX [Helicobacter sp. 12S02634-8]
MNTLKRHFSLIIPLLALLFSLESIVLVNRAISMKEDRLSQSYSILLASQQKLSLETISQTIAQAKSLTPINPDFLLERLKQNMSEANVSAIKKDLPFFYSLKLAIFPNQKQLEAINQTLLKIPSIQKVEAFSKTHNQVYRLLFLIKLNVWIFASLIALLSILLIIRQIQIWRFEHSKRMEIMGFLGAPMWIKNGILFRLAIIDSVITSICILGGTFYLSTLSSFQELIEALEIQGSIFEFGTDFLMLLGTSVGISVFSVLVVIISQRRS